MRHLYRVIGGLGRETITVQGCGNAAGYMMPPYVVYSGKNLRLKWTVGAPEGSRFNTTDKGWMDQAVFLYWFKTLFIPCLPPQRPVVLLFDGHGSHVSLEIVKCARDNGVLILKLPPNTTRFLQPQDVVVYGPAKTMWEKI